MASPTIALYASPPSSVCSTTHQINSHVFYDFELNSRPSSSASSTPPSSTSPSQKPYLGGLSCLFSSPTSKHSVSSSFSGVGEELSSIRHERGEELRELSSSFRFSPSSKFVGSLKRDHQSPVSVFQAPFSSSSNGNGNGSVKSPPMRIIRDGSADVNVLGGSLSVSSGMFNRFVKSALSSCVEYDTAPVETQHGSVSKGLSDGVELAFNLEDCFVVGDLEPYAEELLLDAQSRNKIFRDEFIVKAFYEAERAHRGQSRANGDHYLKHCVETAVLLADIGASSTVVAAGLLHDTLDDTFMSYDYILRTIGAGVADLVEGVSKLSQLSKLARDNNTACKMDEADRLHTMFLAMADARAVLVKLADRLHNMMTLDALTFTKQQRFAKETLEIFAPLANRLGISTWKEQLENLCFKHLNPEIHSELSSQLSESFDEEVITSAIKKLEQALNDDGISYHSLSGRHKSLYSIHCKMAKKKLTMDQIHDIQGLRLIVDNKEDCYKALRIVHQLWCEVPGKSKDYINNPKLNGYQSLHTVVMGDGMVPLEIQIRTKEMHLQAEYGFAAHWRYKEGDCQHSSFVLQMVEWARWVVSWHCEAMRKDQSSIWYADCNKSMCKFPTHADNCPSYKSCCDQDGPVFIIMIENEKMTVRELPANSTMLDLMARAGLGSSRWSNYGFASKEELRPRLNRVPVHEPTCKLKMGDVVELTPALPVKSLTEYREEIQRMYDRGPSSVTRGTTASSMVGWRS